MEAVNAEIAAIVALGRTWGMSDSEISDCLLKSTDNSDKSKAMVAQSISLSSGFGKFLSWMLFSAKFLTMLVLTLTLLYASLEVLEQVDPQSAMKVDASINKLSYPVMRWSRKLFKPIVDHWDIAPLYNSDCLFENPYFFDEVPDCFPCKKLTKLYDASKDTKSKLYKYMETPIAFKIRNISTVQPVYEDIQKMYRKNEVKFPPGSQTTITNLPYKPNMATILSMSEDELRTALDGEVNIRWDTYGVPTAQAVRSLFPRPRFLPDSSEISLEKTLAISGPNSKPLQMPANSFSLKWYQQARGSRKVTLHPHPDCLSDCTELIDTLHPGDLVFYEDLYWKLETEPDRSEKNDELSIGFVGSFQL